MVMFAIICFLLCPLISLPIVFVCIKKDTKHRNVYLAILSIFIALFSYSYTPTVREDLYRHHEDVIRYEDISPDKFFSDVWSRPEQLSLMYKFIISKTGNVRLLQFFTSAICYYILFYLLSEYTKKYKHIKGLKVIGIWFFVLSGFHYIVITSGIFYTLALEIFSLAVYYDYALGRKFLSKILYFAPILIHTCAVLPLFIVILYKLLGSKINAKGISVLVVSIFSISILLNIVASYVNLPIVTELSNLYRSYFGNEEHWSRLHTIPVLVLYLSRLAPIIIGYKFMDKKDSISGFAIFVTIAILVLYFQTTFSVRYIHIATLCGLPILFEAINNKKIGQLFCVLLYGLGAPHVLYQIKQFQSLGEFQDIYRVLLTNIITTLYGG